MPDAPASPSTPPRFDYFEAANRHKADAKALEGMDPPRLANADYHFGIAAECALVAILRTDPTRANLFNLDGGLKNSADRMHIDRRWREFVNTPAISVGKIGAAFNALKNAYRDNPFQGWSVEQRYLSDAFAAAEIPREVVDKHEKAAKFCLELLDKARTWNLPKAGK